MSQTSDSLRHELRTKDEQIKALETKLHEREHLTRDNECLRVQLKSMEQKLERFTAEYGKRIEENRRQEQESHEHVQSLLDEIERIKRDLVLEEYRKQEAERKVRSQDERIKQEQNGNKKLQQDLVQMKQELKSVHLRYDSLQIEMLAMHQANHTDMSVLPSKDTNDSDWMKKPVIQPDMVGTG